MAASTASTHGHGDAPVCPDPSVHEKHNRLSEQASTAALYVTNPERNAATPTSSGRESVLGPDGKLSSRGAAASLKYAKPTDLPSFPSVGLQPNSNSAGAAATLAKDYKMKDLWQPEMSHAGSKAALKAHKDGGKLDLWEPSASSAGNSAAALAMRNNTLSPQIDRGYTKTGKNNSLLAAAMVHNQGRARAGSTPAPKPAAYPDSRNSAQNALSAATISHRASVRVAPSAVSQDGWSSEANQAARVTHIGEHMKAEMFGDRPPVEPEIQEQQHKAALRASAVSMAKQMYDYKEEKRLEAEAAEAVGGAEFAHRRNPSLPSQPDLKQEAMRYIHLQDAAHKLAKERLAKVDKDFQAGRYREYYGYENHQVKQSRLTSVRGRTRRRANSEGARDEDDSDDEDAARRIRQQMSQLSTNANAVDDKKRSDDRAKLLAAAEKRVHARMHDMDEKVFQDTGKVSQSMLDDWEAKARERAEQARKEREQHPGQTHIGGGKFMSQADIEAIAAARLQSTFDEINDTAEKRRARDAEIAREKDAQHTARMEEKMRSDNQKAEFRRIKDADKAAARKEKEDRKRAEQARKFDEQARKYEDKRKSREVKRDDAAAATGATVAGGAAAAEVADSTRKDDVETQQDVQDKRASRGGMLGRIASKLKKRDDGDKPVQATPQRESVVQTEPAVAETTEEHDNADDAAAGVAAAAGLGAVAGIAAASTAKEEGEEPAEDVASVSDVDSADANDLHPVTSAEHTGHFTDAMASTGSAPGSLTKPNLERHISMIHTSDEDSDDFGDDEEDEEEDDELYEREPVSPLAEDEKEGIPSSTAVIAPAATGAVAATTVVPAIATTEPESVPKTEVEPAPAPKIAVESPPAPAPVVKPPPPAAEPSKLTKESKRSGGFFSKLRNRRLKNEPGKISQTAAPVPAPAAAPVTKDDPMVPVTTTTTGIASEPSHAPPPGTASTITSEPPKVSSTLEQDDRESISSFHRHAQDPADPDDVSSSGADEEDISRGRAGRFARKLGIKSSGSKTTGDETAAPLTTVVSSEPRVSTATATTSSAPRGSNDEETFEEARDHFDEGLAPAPAFAGQAKSSSPARETRFQEEL